MAQWIISIRFCVYLVLTNVVRDPDTEMIKKINITIHLINVKCYDV